MREMPLLKNLDCHIMEALEDTISDYICILIRKEPLMLLAPAKKPIRLRNIVCTVMKQQGMGI